MYLKSFYNLSKDQITLIKGVAIIIIVLHNYIHSVSIGENEMSYRREIIIDLWNSVLNDPLSFFNVILSYFGHYGVQLFIFVSGYGLTSKYLRSERKINYKEYISYRFIKIYALLLFALIIHFFPAVILKGKGLSTFLENAFWSLSMLKNLSYDTIYYFIGPWWFFSLILQLYIIFPFLFKYIKEKKEVGFLLLLLISYILIYCLLPITEKLNIPIFGNFLGHLPEFLLGIALAMIPSIRLDKKVILFAFVIFILSQASTYGFAFSFLMVTILLLVAVSPLTLFNEKSYIRKIVLFIGNISMFIFVFNGPIRSFTLLPFFTKESPPLYILGGSLVHLVIVIAFSYITSLIYQKTLKPLSEKLYSSIIKKPSN